MGVVFVGFVLVWILLVITYIDVLCWWICDCCFALGFVLGCVCVGGFGLSMGLFFY